MYVYVDCETMPSTLAADPSRVKPPRNYKDPEKIRHYQEERAIETWRAEALSLTEAAVVMVGAAVDDGPIAQAFHLAEPLVMDAFTAWLLDHAPLPEHPNEPTPVFVAYNGVGFDFPILSTRLLRRSLTTAQDNPKLSAAHLAYARALRPTNGRYGGPGQKDPFVALNFHGSLNEWSRMFGLGHTDVGGGEVFDLIRTQPEAAKAKNRSDVECLRQLHKILRSAGWM